MMKHLKTNGVEMRKEVLIAQEAAEFLGAHVESIRRLARSGAIPSYKIGKDWRFQRQAVGCHI